MRNFFGGDPHFNNVVLQLPLRSHLRDESKTAKAVTGNGNTKVVNDAAYFDGTGDYLELADSAAFQFGSGDVTIEFWARIAADPAVSAVTHFVNRYNAAGGNRSWAVNLYNSAGTVNLYFVCSTDGATSLVAGGAWPHSLDTWYHIAAVRRGTVTKIYVNGIQVGSAGSVSGSLYIGTNTVRVGRDGSGTGELNGYIKDLRITKGVARYISNFTPPSALPAPHGVANLTPRIPTYMKSESRRAPVMARRTEQGGDPYFNNVVLQLPLYSHLRDESKNNRAMTVAGNTQNIYEWTKFDGSGDYITASSSSDFDFSNTHDFTIELRMIVSNAGDIRQIATNRPSANPAKGWALFRQSDNTVGFVAWDAASGTIVAMYSTTAFTVNTRHHVAITRAGSVYRLFVNGLLEASSSSTTAISDSANALYIGRDPTLPTTRDFFGYIKNLRITKGVARYTSNFTPPTSLPAHGVPSRPVLAFAAPGSPISTALSNVYLEALLGWHMAGTVYREAATNWDTLAAALREAVQQWHLVNAAQRDATSQWNTIAAAIRDAPLNWHAAGTVLRAAGFDWGLLNTQERTLNAEWHLVNAALKEAQLDWTKVGYAQADGQLDWHKVGYALREAQIDWHAVVDVLRSGDVNWHLANAVQLDMDNDWHMVAAAMREAVSQWDMGGEVSRNAQLDWNSISTTNRQAFLEWHRVISTQGDAALAWGLCIAAARSSSFAWRLLLAVERDRTLNWNTIAVTLRDAGLDWSMLEPFIHEGRIDWNLANSAEAQAELAWGMVQALLRDEELRWHVTQGAMADAETAWNLIAHVSRDFTAHWGLIGKIVASMDARWDAEMSVSHDSPLAWTVAISAAQSLEAAWNTLGTAAKDATVQWTKIGTAEGSTLLEWRVIPLYGTESPPQYILVIEEENRAIPVDFESRSRLVPAELRTLMVPPAEDDTYGKL